MIITEASFLVMAIADDGDDGTEARARLRGEELAAPHLADLEVTSYVALAELFHAPLLTCDAKMAGGSGARCAFEVFPKPR